MVYYNHVHTNLKKLQRYVQIRNRLMLSQRISLLVRDIRLPLIDYSRFGKLKNNNKKK